MTKKAPRNPIERHYEIGYGKPPVQGQFQKGRSGNPNGRRKKKSPWSRPPRLGRT
jgi:hypothetical protein